MLKKTILIISVILAGNMTLLAQQETSSRNALFSFSPQYIFINGARFDVEIPLKKERQSLNIAPQLYYTNTGDFFGDFFYYYDDYETRYDTLAGAGVNLHHKVLLAENVNEGGFYFSYGLSYNFFNIHYYSYNWETIVEDNLNYIKYTPAYKTNNIHKTGLDFILGRQLNLTDRVFVDIYTGMGMRYSFFQKKVTENEIFSDSMLGYGYSGAVFLFGVKLGVGL